MNSNLVLVIDNGQSYTTHYKMAEILNIDNWDKFHTPIENQVYELIDIYELDNLYQDFISYCYIKDIQTKKGYIIGSTGIIPYDKDLINFKVYRAKGLKVENCDYPDCTCKAKWTIFNGIVEVFSCRLYLHLSNIIEDLRSNETFSKEDFQL